MQPTSRFRERWHDFAASPLAVIALIFLIVLPLVALLAPWITPQNPYDLSSLELWNSEIPPIWNAEGQWPYVLGTDTQGRDILSAILYGSRISLVIGFASVILALAVGLALGLVAGFFGGALGAAVLAPVTAIISVVIGLAAAAYHRRGTRRH